MPDIIVRQDIRPEELPQQSADVVLLMAERHTRATAAMEAWATRAKLCVDMVEGRQWTAADLAKMEKEGRPALMFNKIAPLVRLVLGYHRNNRTDAKFLPDDEDVASDDVAQGLTKLVKRISETNQELYTDAEVFMDGLITGRGFYDHRLSFENNILGEIDVSARDPFTIILDPDGEHYDLNKSCAFAGEDRWVSIDEIEVVYGRGAAALLWPLVYRSGYAGMPSSIMELAENITPWRTFGGQFDKAYNTYMGIEGYLGNAYDPARKNIRLFDCQHQVRVWRQYIVDLETGDQEVVPEHFTPERLRNVMLWAQDKFASMGKANPLRLMKRLGKRVRWTTMVGDIVVYDKWSPYDSYTYSGFFPWFRRGATRGMVDDLIDPQYEINKRRSANIDIVTRSAHSGWVIHTDALTPEEKFKIENYGAAPGVNIFWKGQTKPEKIEQSAPPVAFERLEQKAEDDLKQISGVNDSMTGELDKVQSGRAVEARQRQGVIAIQVYMDNMSRTKHLNSLKKLELIQDHYTEARVYRVTGDQGKSELLKINQRIAADTIMNDVTLGKYRVSIDETPLSASFVAAQLDELMMMVEKGLLPKEVVQDIGVDLSSLPHKDAIKKRVEMLMKSMGLPTVDELEAGSLTSPLVPGPDGQPIPAVGAGAAPGAAPPQSNPAAALAAPGPSGAPAEPAGLFAE